MLQRALIGVSGGLLVCAWATGLMLGQAAPGTADATPRIAIHAEKPAELPGLHNLFRLSEKLYSGSVPEGDTGFASLRLLGIRTILSVDGMPPDTKLAAKYGMRYVHLPFGYDGCPTATADRIVRAVRDLPGPIYVHCHHGKHRAPVAAAVARIGVDGISAEEAVAELKRAGTGTNYAGLYETVRGYHPTPARIEAADPHFVPRAQTPPFVDTMVKIDAHFVRLQEARKAGWPTGTNPADAPQHDALQLNELMRELQRPAEFSKRPADFRQWMAASEQAAHELETALAGRDRERANTALSRIEANCAACHVKYRDIPQR